MHKLTQLFFLLIALTSFQLKAQDATFSQAFAAPLSLNPALTGSFDGRLRLASVYRNQWANQLAEPISSYVASMDMRFPLSRYKINKRDALGFGILAVMDRTPGIEVNSNLLTVGGAYHKSLNIKNTQYLSVGLQFGVVQRSISYQNIFFSDQFNGLDNYSQLSAEDLPENNYAIGDLSAGIVYQVSNANNLGLYAGLSFWHINRPNSSFYRTEEFNNVEVNLPVRYSTFIAGRIPLGDGLQFLPRLNANLQNNRLDLNAGTTFRILIDKYKGTALHLGSWIQADFEEEYQPRFDYLVGMIGIEYSNILFGFSRDFNLSMLSNGRKTWELSVAYLGNYDDELVLCPKF